MPTTDETRTQEKRKKEAAMDRINITAEHARARGRALTRRVDQEHRAKAARPTQDENTLKTNINRKTD
jgi:hypothetical protein